MHPEGFHPEMSQAPKPEEATFALDKLVKAVAARDTAAVQAVCEQLERDFPDQLETVEAIVGFDRYLAVHEQLERHTAKGKERQALIREQAEYNFLMTHVLTTLQDRIALRRIWDVMERMGAAQRNERAFGMMRAGVLSQAATYKIFQRLGHHPELSHPRDDQYNAIDLWEESGVPVQIKSGQDEHPLLLEVDRLGPTHVVVGDAEGEMHVGTKLMQDIERFTMGIKEYERTAGQRLTGHLLVLPKTSYDRVTGEPSDAIVQFVATELGMEQQQAA